MEQGRIMELANKGFITQIEAVENLSMFEKEKD